MENLRIQEIFETIKLHLNNKKYDYFKYNGKLRKVTKVSPSTNYLKYKIHDENHLEYYFISNQIHYYMEHGRFCTFLPEIVNDECLKNYENFLKSLKRIEYSLYSDMESIHSKNEMKKLIDIDYVMTKFYNNSLSLFVILHLFKFTKMKEKWKTTENPLSLDFYEFISKIEPFFKFRKEIFLSVLKKISNS